MAEAGGPTIRELQPKPAGVVEKVKGQLRKLFTPEGRAEAMVQKKFDTILAQVPEDKRAEAMALLEARRPDLVAAALPGAKDSLVRDAAIGAAVVGTGAVVLGVGYWKRERIGKEVGKVGETLMGKLSMENKVKVMSGIQNVNDFRAKVDQGVNKIRDKITGLWKRPLDMTVPDAVSTLPAVTEPKIDINVGTSSSPTIATIDMSMPKEKPYGGA